MNAIERIRPQSKRKAINAQRLASRYASVAAFLPDGSPERARMLEKFRYWQDRYEKYARLSHTWPDNG